MVRPASWDQHVVHPMDHQNWRNHFADMHSRCKIPFHPLLIFCKFEITRSLRVVDSKVGVARFDSTKINYSANHWVGRGSETCHQREVSPSRITHQEGPVRIDTQLLGTVAVQVGHRVCRIRQNVRSVPPMLQQTILHAYKCNATLS